VIVIVFVSGIRPENKLSWPATYYFDNWHLKRLEIDDPLLASEAADLFKATTDVYMLALPYKGPTLQIGGTRVPRKAYDFVIDKSIEAVRDAALAPAYPE
jgi:hypothetical protein